MAASDFTNYQLVVFTTVVKGVNRFRKHRCEAYLLTGVLTRAGRRNDTRADTRDCGLDRKGVVPGGHLRLV